MTQGKEKSVGGRAIQQKRSLHGRHANWLILCCGEANKKRREERKMGLGMDGRKGTIRIVEIMPDPPLSICNLY